VVEVADDEVRVEDLDIGDGRDRARAQFAGALALQHETLLAIGVKLERQLLDVQDDIRHVLADTRDRRELVQDAIDLDRGDRTALQRGQQHAPQRVAQRQAEAPLERFCDKHRMRARRRGVHVQLVRLDQFLPVLLNHFESSFGIRGGNGC